VVDVSEQDTEGVWTGVVTLLSDAEVRELTLEVRELT
jgi:hypothetical protein